MNGYERITAAINGEKPDKIPVMLHNFLMAAKEYGVTMEQYRNDPRIIAESFIAAIEKYQYDGILVDIDTVTLAGSLGVPVDFPVDAPARSHTGKLQILEDIIHMGPPKVENYKYIQIWLEAVRLLKDYFKNEVYVRGNCDQAPFSLAAIVRGIQEWMLDLIIGTEEQVSALLEYCTEATSQFIKLMAQTGCDMVSNGDSLAGPEMISSEMYQRYALPYEKKIVETAHLTGIAYTLHICGNTDCILEFMLQSGADAFELDYKTDIYKIRKTLNDSATLIGNIDPSGVLALGTADQVRTKTRELIVTFSNSNRFILNAGCAIPPITPEENLRAMIDTARNDF